ncbi:MAG TPA: hypothetical protein VGD40_15175 [Chryseosolibacter sp.]
MKKLTRFIVFFLPFLISSCGFYHPNLRNSPMLTKAGEIQGSVQFSRGLEAQGAFAITNNIGLLANYQYINKGTPQNDFEKRSFIEVGAGYFVNRGNLFYEVFAGYGRGHTDFLNQTEQSSGEIYQETGRFNRIFIQPAFGYHTKRHSVSFAPRFSYVDVESYSTTRSYGNPARSSWFAELAGIERWHVHKNLFVTIQGGVNLPLTKELPGVSRIQLGAGVGFRFNAAEQ